ncbi:MAG: large subunit ribosomal protein L7Ae [Candidatus Woesearchaeota archaeon]|jgi:large subunit ribosomal protein L7Ae
MTVLYKIREGNFSPRVTDTRNENMVKKDLTKEQIDEILRIVEVAKSNGKIKKGTNEVTKAVERGTAKAVIVATDANPAELTMHIPLICDEKTIPCFVGGSREEIGTAAGLTVPAVAIAIIDEGNAKADLQKFVENL